MLVTLGVPQIQNDTLCGLGSVLSNLLSNPACVVIPPFSEGELVVREAVSRVGDINFPSFPKSQALAVGLCLLSTHLCSEVIDLTLLVSHFLAFDDECVEVNGQFESDTILSFLIDLIEHHMIPYHQE
jgi:hypothetical protein